MSKVEVNQVTQQCGTTLTVGGGACKTAVVDATTVTLGRCGGTVSLASGASQSGFGRTGTVDWQTGDIKTATFTAATGKGYFCNTTGGAFIINLPAGSAGDIVSVQDYANTFDTYTLTVSPDGSEKINGGSAGGNVVLNTEGEGLTLVYIDGTQGWRSIQDSAFADQGAVEITATVSGACNTLTTAPDCANVKIATFKGPGTFCVSQISGTGANNTVGYMVIAGGGGGGSNRGGGAGAGGFREGRNVPVDNFTASPLVADAPTNAITVTATGYPITIGGGGAGSSPCSSNAVNGNPSTFSCITSTAGGSGGSKNAPQTAGAAGGSGGGGFGGDGSNAPGGVGNTPPVSPSQGFGGAAGSTGGPNGAGGGAGGATAAGSAASPSPGLVGGNAGAGATTSISGSPTGYSGGGGGSPWNTCSGGTASDGGGAGVKTTPVTAAIPGTVNTGGGGGGGPSGGTGGSGIVIIRYKFQ